MTPAMMMTPAVMMTVPVVVAAVPETGGAEHAAGQHGGRRGRALTRDPRGRRCSGDGSHRPQAAVAGTGGEQRASRRPRVMPAGDYRKGRC